MPNKTKKNKSLATTIALYFVTLGLIVLLVSNFLGLYINFKTQNRVVAEQQHLIAEGAANTVESFIQERIKILKTTCHFNDFINLNRDEQKLVLEKLIGLESSFRQLEVLDGQFQEQEKVSRLSNFSSIDLSELSENEMPNQVKELQAYISPVYIDKITSEPMVVMTVPITDIFGDFKGALLAEINLKFLWELVDSIKVGQSGLAYVVNRQGNLIAFKDISRVLKGENVANIHEVKEYVESDVSYDEDNLAVYKGILGGYVAGSYARLNNPDWAVIIESPVQEVYGSVIYELLYSIIIIVLSIILTILASIYLAKNITRPIITLRDAAVQVGEGRLDTQMEIDSKNELGDLAHAFKQMIVDLKKSKAETEKYSKNLEAQVADRTKELQVKMEELERFNKLAVDRELKMIELKKKIKEMENMPRPDNED